MTIFFTDEEKEYLVEEKFNWKIASGCPEDVRKTLQEKLDLLKAEEARDYG
jgi:hypothetical protein